MTTVDAGRQPRLRPEIVLGPGQRRGEGVVHHVKDPLTGWFYRIGPREHFLLSRMDGTRSLDDLGADYAETFGRRLGPESWQQLFGMLYKRQLLAGATDDEALARLTASAAENAERAKRGPLQARFPLFDPDALFQRVGPRLSGLFHRGFVVPALAAVLALAGYVAYAWPQLTDAAFAGRRGPLPVVLGVLVAWAIIFLHECAHGLTCWHFGGRAKEIGLMWRFPMLAPYCKVDDVVLLPPGRRVATAFAGVFVSMLALLPFAGLWALAPDGHTLHSLAGSILLFGTVTAGINLVPFLRLDGYYMLTHALNLADLRGESYRFYGRLLRGGPAAVAGYPRRDRAAYAGYGLASAVFAVTVCTLLVRLWYTSLAGWVGGGWAVLILVAEGVLVLLLIGYGVRRRRARSGGA
ncbi:hypothetical protein [Micromonospora sp. NPDC092111]|uniref:hypothetical protein n=1 Tax=Micromonospora sp. NPDC092111 TaxID=3364289 RepID=UPI0037F7E4E4